MKFVKHDQNKPRYMLFPPGSLMEVLKVLEHGAKKYSDDNWKKCDDPNKYVNALYRHFDEYAQGRKNDNETGLSHMAHVVCCALFLIWLDKNKHEWSDREIKGFIDHMLKKLKRGTNEKSKRHK